MRNESYPSSLKLPDIECEAQGHSGERCVEVRGITGIPVYRYFSCSGTYRGTESQIPVHSSPITLSKNVKFKQSKLIKYQGKHK